jgi:hypothetical protein
MSSVVSVDRQTTSASKRLTSGHAAVAFRICGQSKQGAEAADAAGPSQVESVNGTGRPCFSVLPSGQLSRLNSTGVHSKAWHVAQAANPSGAFSAPDAMYSPPDPGCVRYRAVLRLHPHAAVTHRQRHPRGAEHRHSLMRGKGGDKFAYG